MFIANQKNNYRTKFNLAGSKNYRSCRFDKEIKRGKKEKRRRAGVPAYVIFRKVLFAHRIKSILKLPFPNFLTVLLSRHCEIAENYENLCPLQYFERLMKNLPKIKRAFVRF